MNSELSQSGSFVSYYEEYVIPTNPTSDNFVKISIENIPCHPMKSKYLNNIDYS